MNETLNIYLQQEEEKIKKADELKTELSKVWFGMLNPRWWKVRNELLKVVMSFKLCDNNYNINIPEINESTQ